MHVQTDLLDSISNIWPSERQVLQGTSKTPIIRGISHWRTSISWNLRICVDWSRTRLALCHLGMLQNIQHELPLRKKKALATPLNSHTQKVMQFRKVLHREFLLEGRNNPPKKTQ
jgi:hypothetical protein